MLTKKFIWFVLVSAVSLGIACGLGEQTEEANRLVDEANVVIEKNNELIEKTDGIFMDLFGDNLTAVKDFKAYKEKNKTKFDEVIKITGQIEKQDAEVTDKFQQASRLKLNEKYKEYLNIKIQEMQKRTDSHKLVVPFVKKFLETNDVDEINVLIENYNNESAAFNKEVDELSDKGTQIEKENPNVIKK